MWQTEAFGGHYMETQTWVCTQRVPNFREAENVQPSEAKARRTLPSARAWLWIAPDPVSHRAADGARVQFPSPLNVSTHRRPVAPP